MIQSHGLSIIFLQFFIYKFGNLAILFPIFSFVYVNPVVPINERSNSVNLFCFHDIQGVHFSLPTACIYYQKGKISKYIMSRVDFLK